MLENKIKVYIKIDENNCIIDINSSIFLSNTENYICIDEGFGDKYSHAQGNYFDVKNGEKPLRDSKGRCNYKYIDNKVVELTEEEKENLFPVQEPQPSREEQLEQQLLETQALVANLQEQILLNQGGTK